MELKAMCLFKETNLIPPIVSNITYYQKIMIVSYRGSNFDMLSITNNFEPTATLIH